MKVRKSGTHKGVFTKMGKFGGEVFIPEYHIWTKGELGFLQRNSCLLCIL